MASERLGKQAVIICKHSATRRFPGEPVGERAEGWRRPWIRGCFWMNTFSFFVTTKWPSQWTEDLLSGRFCPQRLILRRSDHLSMGVVFELISHKSSVECHSKVPHGGLAVLKGWIVSNPHAHFLLVCKNCNNCKSNNLGWAGANCGPQKKPRKVTLTINPDPGKSVGSAFSR